MERHTMRIFLLRQARLHQKTVNLLQISMHLKNIEGIYWVY